MVITVVGTGFVGVVTSAVLAKFGNTVYGLDIDREKVDQLSHGKVPFYEPNLSELVTDGIEAGRLIFTTDYRIGVSEAEVIIITVGTPSAEDGTADLSYVMAAAESAAEYLKENAILAIKSTVPPGTNDKVIELVKRVTDVTFAVAALPEFLREGAAVQDSLHPDRVVIGSKEPWVIEKLLTLHKPLNGERVVISAESAQMAKYGANAYLAQRITFINQIANLCEKNDAKVSEVIEVIGHDRRIGHHYWYPGLGYGGSCFPKDVKELAAYSRSVGEGDGLFVKIDELNTKRVEKKLAKFEQLVGGFEGKKVTILGLSFKPNTNDLREAPSMYVIPFLQERKVEITAYDPEANTQAKQLFPEVQYQDDPYQAITDTDVIFLLVEWDELLSLDLNRVAELANDGAWFFDTRNQYDSTSIEAVGLTYVGIGNG